MIHARGMLGVEVSGIYSSRPRLSEIVQSDLEVYEVSIGFRDLVH